MATTVPVSFFNANILDVTVQVNNGPQFSILGAGSPNYSPNLPTTGGPTWNPNQPAPGALGPGNNNITMTPSGSTSPFNFQVPLSLGRQYISMQFYAFWNSSNTVSWILLDNGAYVDGSIAVAETSSKT